MSLQTNVFENGRWVTRSLDPYHVRAQNTRREEEKTASLSNSPEKAPSLGLLTRTLVRSSVTKWIIPARIRHKTKNDVLFIGADCVTIKEASGDYTLKNVAVKDDFDSPIRAARILGDPRECDEGDKYNAVERAAKTFTLTRGALTGQIYGEWPIRVDGAKNPESVAYLPRELPPHVLVLTLESNQLVFMCAVNGPSNQPPLLSSQHPLPVARSLNQRLGQRIAVDPKSRAMAVAAHEGVVCLYALKSMDLMRKELREGLGLNPIREERLLPVDGVIQKMEFLRPPDNDPGQVILLLIVSWKAKCMMIWYDWNTANNLRESQLQATRYPLPEQERSPLLLIPLTKSTTFMLVCKRAITLYKDLLIGTPTRYVQHLEEEKDPEEPGTSRSLPLWTQWARPVRSGGHRFTQAEDAIYLCREDGIVQYLEFYNNVDHMLNSTHQAGRLGITVDTAFAILDVGPNTKDLIAVGGDESEGGLWRVEPRTDGPILVDVIANWAPLSDFTMFSDPDDPRDKVGDIAGPSLACRGQQRMFAYTGRNKHGAVSDLRYGVQASQLVQAADFSSDDTRDAMQSGVMGIWAFHGFFGDTEYQFQGREERLKDVTYVLISHPTHTSLLFMPLEQVPELVTDASLDLTTCTIFASITASGQLIQVTESSIILSSISPPQEYIDEDKKKKFKYQGVQSGYASQIADSSARIMAACIYNDDKESIILAAVQRDGHYYLQLANIVTTYERQGDPWLLDSQPSCMQLHKAEHTLLALVATVDGKFQVFIVGDLGLVRSKASPYTFPAGSFAICDSIAIMTSKSEAGTVPQHLVVCGLRNGLIQTLHCTEADSIYNLTLCETLVVGNTSVTVVTDITRQSRVICHCERSLCTLEYPAYSLYRAPATAHIIWMTDRDKPAFTQGALSMFTQAVHSWLPEEVPGLAAGALIGINGESLQVLKLDSDPEAQMVPQRQTVGGTPQRIIYSCYLSKLIVLYKKLRVTKAPLRNASRIVLGTRAWQPSIAFLDPDTTTTTSSRADVVDVKQENVQDENDELLVSERKATEEFLGVSEWFPNINGDQYHFLVVNTKLEQNSKEVGRLLVFKVVKQANCKPRLFTKKKIMLPAPVYYVAEYPDKQSIIYCSGSKLYLQSLDPAQSGLKFQTPIMAEMRSPIRYLTIKAPYIFVSSSRESLAVYKYEAGKLVYQYGDQSARAGLHHVHVPEHSLVLASDNGNAVIGLWQPPERRIDNTMTPVFEAILPRSMTCLSRVTRPVWYRNLDKPRNEQSIIGGSIDGTIIQFDVLTKGWRLLRFIQNMAERNEVICPFRGGGPFKRHIEPSTSKPHYMHINGDILKRVVERGGEQVIKGMLDLEPDLDSHTDFDTAEARWERFKELAEEAVDTTDGNWLANVVQWLRYRLLSAL